MRHLLLSSFAAFAACLLFAGCGSSSSSKPANQNDGKLNGTYVFQQQVYTYYSDVESSAARSHTARSAQVRRLARPKALDETSSLHRPFHRLVTSSARPVAAQGSDPNNTGVVWGAMVGSLTFDGKGKVTGGEIDYNEPQMGYFKDTVRGDYTIFHDNSGTIQIVSKTQGATFFFNIALEGSGSTAAGAQMVESYSDNDGNVEIGTGVMLRQSSGVSQSSLSGNYVFGMQGETCYGCSLPSVGDLYAAGVLAANGSGGFSSSSEADVATVFATQNAVPLSGTYGQPDSFGRSAVSLNSNGAMPQNYVLYAASSSKFFLLATDSSSSEAPAYLFGEAGLQSGTFSNATLSGNYVLAENTEDLQNEQYLDTYSDAYLALLSASGGHVTGTGDANKAGNVSSNVAYNYGAYTVQPNGRVTFTGTTPSGAPAPVLWLQNSSFGYGIDQLRGSTTTQEPGLIYLFAQQAGSGYNAASLNGYYALGTLPAATSNSFLYIAAVTSDGSANLSGSGATSFFDQDGGSGGTGSANGKYTISSDGRGTITGTNDSIFGDGILYTVSGAQSVTMDVSDGDIAPSLQTFGIGS
ncbi:MAG: hypothetical protein ABI076_01595 [Acidobacteriaceae bacterium]